ncbi:hypothetical protein NYO91_04670 [Arhodomonas aquaeolei]|uniref:sarcosine oxidase subunit gamma n=1 Tax=Arhodomonas aquaeolei TaxID=2369 RepID=UPI0021688AC8|nr:sarcosine oxidase subunit gamma family protein [Arhodomonas aquaeolei]MCS4503371.1 hypothetical protein [Arhodomonas aquaeolei]
MFDVKHESPLVGQSDAAKGVGTGSPTGVSLFERPFLGHLNLRGNPRDAAFTEACTRVLGTALPTEPNTVAEGGSLVVAWLGPDEWLVMTEPDLQESVTADLREALGQTHSAVTDVSGGQTVIVLHGDHAADVLAKASPLDVHPRVFGAGQCARTVVAKSAAFIRVLDPGMAFEVVIRRSLADYLWQWFRDAAGEYGCAVLSPQSALSSAVNHTGACASWQTGR